MQQVEDGVGVEGVPWLLKSPHALDGAGMRRDILKKKKPQEFLAQWIRDCAQERACLMISQEGGGDTGWRRTICITWSLALSGLETQKGKSQQECLMIN